MSALLLLILSVGSTAAAAAPAGACPAVHVRNPDGNYIVPGVQGGIPYSGELALDAYVQPGTQLRPAVVVIHGGGWVSGSRVAYVGQILELLTRAGYSWFSVDYRLGGLAGYQNSLADLRAAVAFVRCRAAELRVDATRLVLLGEDSGAHLAALLAAERLPGIAGAALLGGFYDLSRLPDDMAAGAGRDLLVRASPASRVVPRMPPLLVIHGGADTLVPIEDARRYCRAVVSARNGRCRFVEEAGASHRVENWWPSQWTYKRHLVEWLQTVAPAPLARAEPQAGPLHKNIVFSSSPRLTLDAFLPPAARPVPAVVLVHGGGWEAGDKVTYITPLFEPLARAGLAWFSIDYRLTPAARHEDQLEDVRQALRFVRAEHARFNIDPARIVLVGESSGGHLVTQIAAEDGRLAGVVSFYGVYDLEAMVTDASPRSLLMRLFRRGALGNDARALLRQYSPVHRAHAGMPPVLLVNGTGERLWEQAQTFAARLTQLQVDHELIVLEGAPHGMENWEGRPEWTGYKPRVVLWIQRTVRPRS